MSAFKPLRLEHQLKTPLTVPKGQRVFVAYRQAVQFSSETCALGCADPYGMNTEWFATDQMEPINWKSVSERIQMNLAVCLNPGCFWK